MKKYLALGLSAVMACSIVGLAGCDMFQKEEGSENSPVVAGNYTTVTESNAQAFDTVLKTVAPEGFVGDVQKPDWKLGASLLADLDIYVHNTEADGGYDTTEISLNADLKTEISKAPESATDSLGGVYVKASGDAKLNVNSAYKYMQIYEDPESFVEETMNGSFDGKAYIDTLTTYAEYDIETKENGVLDEEDSQAGAIKVDTMVWLEEIIGAIDDTGISFPSMDEESFSCLEMVQAMNEVGVTLGYDISNGVKFKLSISGTTLNELLNDMVGYYPEESVENVELPVINVKSSKLDVYMAIDATGELAQVSVDANVDASVSYEGDSYVIKASGYVILKTNDSIKVELPANLATDPKYQAI